MEDIKSYRFNTELMAQIKCPNNVQNGGLPYAAVLLGVLFKHCNGMARIYCQGFKPELVCEPAFWVEFYSYVKNPNNRLYALIDTTEWVNEKPMKLLKQVKNERSKTEQIIEYKKRKDGTGKNKRLKRVKDIIVPDTSIIVKLIHPESAKMIAKRYGESIHFSVFDNEKFRYEYDSENYKAYGSFNQPDNCRYMIETFDQVFNDPASKIII